MTVPDPLNRFRIAGALAGQRIGCEIHIALETGSTNDDTAALARSDHPEGVVMFAESQSSGRGRRGNEWLAAPGSCLLFSILLRPAHPPRLWRRLTHLCALALCEAIDENTGLRTGIKWPNDVYINGKKVAGILVESTARGGDHPGDEGFAVAGIGLNVNMLADEFPPELRATATSLQLESPNRSRINRTSLAIGILHRFNRHYPDSLADPRFATSLDQIRMRSHLLGKQVGALVSGTRMSGIAQGLGPDGELVLVGPDGTQHMLVSADLVRVLNPDPASSIPPR